MHRSYSVVCEEDLAERIDSLAREYELTRQEVLRQLITVGLEELEGDG